MLFFQTDTVFRFFYFKNMDQIIYVMIISQRYEENEIRILFKEMLNFMFLPT